MQGNAFSESYSGLGDQILSQEQEGRSPPSLPLSSVLAKTDTMSGKTGECL
jgi:hypothetical protein